MTAKKVAILQSNYIPWKGYFDLIASVDEFIIYDEVQFTRQDWRNRNRIKTSAGTKWLTVPVCQQGRLARRISEIQVPAGSDWSRKHWATISQSYARAPFFRSHKEPFERYYATSKETRLSRINCDLMGLVMEMLGIKTTISQSSDFRLEGDKSQRLIGLCQATHAATYLSGPAARGYLDVQAFASHGIAVEWMDYSRYLEYPQVHPPFDHYVTILDPIFHLGDEALRCLRRTQRSDSQTE